LAAAARSGEIPEFKVKREAVYEFSEKPRVTRRGDQVTIAFASKGFCDVTVAIEGPEGRIVRHLASGVLGPNAPAPFAKNSKRQAIVWDGKNDQGRYIDEKEPLSVRVSLGLKPRFEKTLFWSPKKRIAPGNRSLFAAGPEGVYVFEGGGVDHIKLFSHKGEYVRTVYPFPPKRGRVEAEASPDSLKRALSGVKGLKWMTFPQDGRVLPVWRGLVQATLFTSGNNTGHNTIAKYGRAASAFALHGKRLALVMLSLNRVATDGTTGGLPLEGPKTAFTAPARRGKPAQVGPRSATFSPDGRWLYMTGYGAGRYSWLHGVVKLDYLGDKPPQLFAGSMKPGSHGTGNGQFRCALSVACDSKGRVYVADWGNNRIQVFAPDGKHVKNITNVRRPVEVFVHPKSGHIYVGSWMLLNRFAKENVPARLTHLGPLERPTKIASYPLPFVKYNAGVSWNRTGGVQHGMFVDCLSSPPTVWVVPGTGDTTSKLLQLRADYSPSQFRRTPWMGNHYQLYREGKGKLVKKADFGMDVAKSVYRVTPPQAPSLDRQRMYVDPTSGMVYIAEGDCGVGKAFRKLLRLDPDTGKAKDVRLPFSTEEIAFDLDGLIYLRTDTHVARFNPKMWREIPWDYGEMRDNPGFDGDGRRLISTVPMPGSGRPGCFHLGGFGVSPKGHMVVSCYNVKKLAVRIPGAFSAKFESGRPYSPSLYPGRIRWGELHVWDRYGKIVRRDAVQGLPMTDGLAMDKDDNIYVLVAANRIYNGKEYPLERAETLMKFKLDGGRIISTSKRAPIKITKAMGPKRPFDITKGFAGRSWVKGAEWMYGGVGYGGFMSSKGGGGCACWNARFALDLFARSFATELNRFRVAVLDTNGNLITRIGKYGNVDDGVPLIKTGGPARPRPVGGDEVALMHPSYVATHTDRRLFIADYGNFRILSVRLAYHANETIRLRDVPDEAAKRR
jgi:sugar lactone lactonase YvrE